MPTFHITTHSPGRNVISGSIVQAESFKAAVREWLDGPSSGLTYSEVVFKTAEQVEAETKRDMERFMDACRRISRAGSGGRG